MRQVLRAATLALAAMLGTGASTPAPAATATGGAAPQYGVGIEAGALPALSVQWLVAPFVAYHVTAHLDERGAALSADYQHFYVPPYGRGEGWTLAFYGGIGLGGQDRQGSDGEEYRMRLPIGAQCDLSLMHLSVFMEAAGLVGPLPLTEGSLAAAGGLRARF